MSYKLYLIKDIHSCFQPQVYCFQNDDMAKRWFYQLYRDAVDHEPNGVFAAFPDDFQLWSVGDLECDDGFLHGHNAKFVCKLSEFKEV